MIKMFNCFNLDTLLRCVFSWQVLSGLCLSTVLPSDDIWKVCINATCGQNRKKVVSIFYGNRDNFSKKCEVPVKNKRCSKRIQNDQELKTLGLCSELTKGCHEEEGQQSYSGCKDRAFNVERKGDRCAHGADIIYFCDANATLTGTRTKHLLFSSSYAERNRFKICTCSITGGHTVTAVRAGIYTRDLCGSTDLSMVYLNKTVKNITVSKGKSFDNEDFTELESSRIRLISNCSRYIPVVWFKIKADDEKTVRIQCIQSIGTSPGTSSPVSFITRQTVDTAAPPTPNTLGATIHDTISVQIPVIVGSVIGGLVLIIIVIVIALIVYRLIIRETQKPPSELDTIEVAVENTYDEIDARNHPTYTNNAFEEGTTVTDFSSVADTDVIIENENDITPTVSSTDYDKLKPATIFPSFSYQDKKANSEQHNEVPLYDHTKKQTKSGNDLQGNGNSVNASDYDVLESKANLKSSFDNVEISKDDTYNHIGDNQKEPDDNQKEPSNNPGQLMMNAAKSAPIDTQSGTEVE